MMLSRKAGPTGAGQRPGPGLSLPVAAAAAAALLFGAPEGLSAADGLRTGNHVRALAFTDLSGKTRAVTWNGKGAPATIFYFFDARSAEGLHGITYFDRLHQKAGDFGLEVIAVEAGGREVADIEEALERYRAIYPDPSFPVVPDTGGTLRAAFGVTRLPATFIVEKHGVIFFDRSGFDEETGGMVSERVVKALGIPEGVVDDAPRGQSPPRSDEDPSADGAALLFPGDRLPPLAFTDITGKNHAFEWGSKEEESVLFFFFWGDPCRPCIEEMLFLDQLTERAAAYGLDIRVMAVERSGLDSAAAGAVLERYTRFYPYPSFPIVLDSENGLSGIFGRPPLPATFLLNARGELLTLADRFDKDIAGEWIALIERILPRSERILRSLLK